MSRTYWLVVALALCLASRGTQADTVACDLPDLGLINASAAEEIDAMLKQAAACVREKKPGRAVPMLTQVIKNDPHRLHELRQCSGHFG